MNESSNEFATATLNAEPGPATVNRSILPAPMSRRRVVQSLAVGAAVLVAGRVRAGTLEVLAPDATDGAAINAYIAIAPDGHVTLQCAQSEIGQGIATTFAAILADELEADWSKCTTVFSPAAFSPGAAPYKNPRINFQFTGNSESISSFHPYLRKMGAAAREMLIAAAADHLRVPALELTARNGVVHHRSGRSVTFGEIAVAAAAKPVPSDPKIKPESEWRLLGHGRSLPRMDIPDKVVGKAVFGIDVKVPNMAHAAVMSAPMIGGQAGTIDDSAAAGMPGVLKVVSLGGAVAVVAEHYWQARLALTKLKVSWQPAPGGAFDDASLEAMYRKATSGATGWANAENNGDALGALAGSGKVIEAEYRSPWTAHATMEPMNATVEVTADGAIVWAPTQGPQLVQIVLATVLKVDPAKVVVNRTYVGGGFGRRLIADFVVQAALCSKAVGRPVKLIWSREEDIRQDSFRPAFVQHMRAALGKDGYPSAMHIKLVAPTILRPVSSTPGEPSAGKIDALCVESLRDHPYNIANRRADFNMLEVAIPTMVLRTTGHGPNNFAIESFIDELAHMAGIDPYQYRRHLLRDDPASLAVLDRAAKLAGWGKAPAGHFHGISFVVGFGSCLCQVVELSMVDGAIKLHKITSVADAGRTLDRINSVSMIEGGVVWGLSVALYSGLSFDQGRPRETNFDAYRVATVPDVPELITEFLENRKSIGGLGEIGPVCVPAALCNALFAATGKRHRQLPLSRERVFTVYGKLFS
jgi:isoquinoline 1-oxidoreductase subunit beta